MSKHSLLEFSAISTVIYFKSPSIILLFIFTVNNCDSYCIMGIFCDVKHHIQMHAVFLKIAVYSLCYNSQRLPILDTLKGQDHNAKCKPVCPY